jgi:hypothetical protein
MIETNFWCGVFILALFTLSLTVMAGISWFVIPIIHTVEWLIDPKTDDFAKYLIRRRIDYAKSVISFPERFKQEWRTSRHHKLSLFEEFTRFTLGLYILHEAWETMLWAIHENSSWQEACHLAAIFFCGAALLFVAYELFWVILKKATKHPHAPRIFNARF